jgi:hypothetical protein
MANIQDELEKFGLEIIKFMGNNMPVDSGDLKNSMKMEINKERNVYTLSIFMDRYGEYVNYGTKPHMPPVKAIESWAERKGINPWAVAMNIKKYGTKPHKFIPEVNDIENMIERLDFSDYFKSQIEEIIKNNNK